MSENRFLLSAAIEMASKWLEMSKMCVAETVRFRKAPVEA